MDDRPPLTDVGQFDWWPALILVADLSDLVKMRSVIDHCRRRHPALPEVDIEVADVLLGVAPGQARMFRSRSDAPPILRSGVTVRD